MSFFDDVRVRFQDSHDLDAFGRQRVSTPFNIFDAQFTYDLQPLFFEQADTGTGTITHVPDSSSVTLSTGGVANGDGTILQSRQYFRYLPGKGQQIVFTATLSTKTADVRKRIGYFDGENGLFFEQDGSNLKIVRRTNTSGAVVNNEVNQSAWNLDTLDGSGGTSNPSGITFDEDDDNIFVIDFQWLGAGRIRYGFYFSGQITYVHQILYANTAAVPFMTTGNLPFRAEIFNTAAAAGTTTYNFTCVGVASESGFNPLGIPGSVQSTALRNVTTGNDPLPILSIRPRTTFNAITNRGLILPLSFGLMSEDATVRYELILNGTLTGAAFADVDTTNSLARVDVAATAITGGVVVDSGFVSGAQTARESGTTNRSLLGNLILTNDIAGTTTDILSVVISIINSAGTASDCGGCFTWDELR